MEKYIKEGDLVNTIKEVICELCPVKKPRISFDEDTYRYENTDLKITFYFYEVKDFVCVQICFWKNDKGTFKYCLVDEKISNDVIGDLIRFLLSEFPYVNSLYTHGNGFELFFGLGLEHHEKEGVSCNKLGLSFNTHPDLIKRFSSLFDDYLKYIMFTFQEEISKNPECAKGYYKGYYDMIKPMKIRELSSFDLRKIASLLSDDEICELLCRMSNDRFFELYDMLKNDSNVVKGKVLELKKNSGVDD